MKRLLLILAIVLFATSVAQAQTDEQTTLRLRSGVEITGTIIEHNSDGSVMIQTDNGDKFYYRKEEIAQLGNKDYIKPEQRMQQRTERIERSNERSSARSEERNAERTEGKFKGYRGILSLSLAYGADKSYVENGLPSLTVINGYHFGPGFYAGIGTGVSFPDWSGFSIPLYLHLRTEFCKGFIAPYVAMDIGYQFSINGEIEVEAEQEWNNYYESYGGLFFEPAIGLMFRIKGRKALWFGMSFPVMIGKIYDYYEEKELPKLFSGSIQFGFSW